MLSAIVLSFLASNMSFSISWHQHSIYCGVIFSTQILIANKYRLLSIRAFGSKQDWIPNNLHSCRSDPSLQAAATQQLSWLSMVTSIVTSRSSTPCRMRIASSPSSSITPSITSCNHPRWARVIKQINPRFISIVFFGHSQVLIYHPWVLQSCNCFRLFASSTSIIFLSPLFIQICFVYWIQIYLFVQRELAPRISNASKHTSQNQYCVRVSGGGVSKVSVIQYVGFI